MTDTLVVKVDAEPEATGAALEHLGLTATAAAALSAVGGVDRMALAPANIQTFDTPAHVKVIWDLGVQRDALEGACLSMTRRFAATDEATRTRLLDSWAIVGTARCDFFGPVFGPIQPLDAGRSEPKLSSRFARNRRLNCRDEMELRPGVVV